MFRRKESSLPKDFEFPSDLGCLGYYVNEDDQIRNSEKPDQQFHYFISKNERYVEMHGEAMDECVRRIVRDRLLELGLHVARLPLGATTSEPHVPIMTSDNLDTCKRVIVYFGENCQDIGILAGRLIGSDSLNHGSIIETVKYIKKSTQNPKDAPGIVIANPSQLLWYRRGKKALSWKSWYAIPKRNAVGAGIIVTEKNKIFRNEGTSEHVACVFEDILAPMAKRGCKIDTIAVSHIGHDILGYLQKSWTQWDDSMEALAIVASSYVWSVPFVDEKVKTWFGKRARAYLLNEALLGTPLTGRHKFGCNVYSSGERYHVECIMPHAHRAILQYFKLVSRQPDYENVPQNFPEPVTVTHAPKRVSDCGFSSDTPLEMLPEEFHDIVLDSNMPDSTLSPVDVTGRIDDVSEKHSIDDIA